VTAGTRLESLLALRRRDLAEAQADLTRADALLAEAERELQRTREAARSLSNRAGGGAPCGPMPAGWLACGSALHACEVERAARLATDEETCLRKVVVAREARECAGETVSRAVRAMRAVERGMAAARTT
jgi:hypothetical protein